MPPDLTDADKDAWAAAHPGDPHRAAAEAWDAWAGTLAATPRASRVNTGDQDVTYEGGGSEFDAASQRADWHRARSKAQSVGLTTRPGVAMREGWNPGRDPEDEGTIPTAVLPPRGEPPPMLEEWTP